MMQYLNFCRHSGNRILQPNYLFLQPKKVSPLLFIPREQSKWAQCYSRDGKVSSYSYLMVQSKVKVHKILPQAHDIWE